MLLENEPSIDHPSFLLCLFSVGEYVNNFTSRIFAKRYTRREKENLMGNTITKNNVVFSSNLKKKKTFPGILRVGFVAKQFTAEYNMENEINSLIPRHFDIIL